MTPDYCAPALVPFTELHIWDPCRRPPSPRLPLASYGGRTYCDVPFLNSESWQLVDRQPGERVCGTCEKRFAAKEGQPASASQRPGLAGSLAPGFLRYHRISWRTIAARFRLPATCSSSSHSQPSRMTRFFLRPSVMRAIISEAYARAPEGT